ncbi:D-alanyl-D-alanine carboxypeptidase (penicillin-binding protein 5/6) [Natranaerovirga pectinivora]|uniref:serine-type D-Ala-D-Ala carboxypeptidase n=1 Tax=Natranaerovirga pectinivora TaxID=682400 RepID=A0A4R3MPU9_9FIRM|nr:D-alanyl-D-alanine carboxypeptidase family protein [Natranaerovirga pectinivora]TCT15012.1 D-alanyl-D-alanine carboxypeptidase (penicillin-binding protein 5/6) [Natranaerovirga pectinivora]
MHSFRKRRFLCLIFSIILGFVVVNNSISAEDVDLRLHALAAILMDGDNGRVLWEHNGTEQRAMASTTKIMTTMIVLEYGNLEDEVEVSKRASQAPDVQLHIREGEKYRLGDLLYALMLESSNDVAIAIAEHVGGSVEEFAQMMTEKAKDVGAHNTSFKTPNGLDAEGHYSTAYDLAIIAKYALENEQFREIIRTRNKQFYELTNNRHFHVYNKNAFLDQMNGAIGVKTGFTNQAGYCFVGAVERDGKLFISVVLGSGWPYNRQYKWQDTQKIMNYALDNYEYQKVVEGKINLDPVEVIDGKVKDVPIELYGGEVGLLLNDNEVVRKDISIPEYLDAPIQDNVTVGYLSVYIDDELYTMLPIKTTESVEKIDFKFCLDIIIKKFLF